MKTLFLRVSIVGVLLFVLSCKKKEDPAPPAHSFTFKGKTYDIKDVVYKNWGASDLIYDASTANTHYAGWIVVSDGTISIKGTDISATNATYIVPLTVVMRIDGSDGSFKAGTYTSVLSSNFFAGNFPHDKDFFSQFLFRFDQNSDSKFGPEDLWVDGSNGTLTLTNLASTVKIEFNVNSTAEGTGTLPENVGLPIVGKYEGAIRVLP